MKRTSSQAFAVAVPRPLPSAPTTIALRGGRSSRKSVSRPFMSRPVTQKPASWSLRTVCATLPVSATGTRSAAPALVLITVPGRQAAAALRNQDGGGSRGLRAAYHRAEVVRVLHVVAEQYHDGFGRGGKFFEKLVRIPELRLRQVGRDALMVFAVREAVERGLPRVLEYYTRLAAERYYLRFDVRLHRLGDKTPSYSAPAIPRAAI